MAAAWRGNRTSPVLGAALWCKTINYGAELQWRRGQKEDRRHQSSFGFDWKLCVLCDGLHYNSAAQWITWLVRKSFRCQSQLVSVHVQTDFAERKWVVIFKNIFLAGSFCEMFKTYFFSYYINYCGLVIGYWMNLFSCCTFYWIKCCNKRWQSYSVTLVETTVY